MVERVWNMRFQTRFRFMAADGVVRFACQKTFWEKLIDTNFVTFIGYDGGEK